MRLINRDILMQGKIEESILIKSFEEYKTKGGNRDMLDVYAFIKERAKKYEGEYISLMDQACSGIEVSDSYIRECQLASNALWYILHLWFDKPIRKANYSTFNLQEFNRL